MTKINPGAMNLNARWIEIVCARRDAGNPPETADRLGDPYGIPLVAVFQRGSQILNPETRDVELC